MADSAPPSARLPRSASTKGAPRKIYRKHGTNVTQVVSSPPSVPASAVPSDTAATAPTQRGRHIQQIAERGRMCWQRETGYGRRSKGETAMGPYKGILGNRLHARTLPAQQTEAIIGVTALNRMLEAGRPASVRKA